MGISNFRTKIGDVKIESLHFPIVDKWIPSAMDDLVKNVELLVDRIKKGRSILVHCNGGKGRTGLLVVSALVALGLEVNDAVQVIRDARPGMIQNPVQLIYARAFKKVWFQNHRL
jgi:protein-tyrosine phosphatase